MNSAAVILDVDGTLVDSNDAHARAWVDAFHESGITVDFERVRRAIGMGGDKLLPSVAGLDKETEPGATISERRGAIFKERYLPHVKPFPDVRRLVERMMADGYRIIVASSAKDDELGPLLERAGVDDLVSVKTSSDDAERSKPDPDIVTAALSRAQCGAGESVMLGDTPYDVEAASRAGVAIVGVRCGGWDAPELAGAVEVYDDPEDVLRQYESSLFFRLVRG